MMSKRVRRVMSSIEGDVFRLWAELGFPTVSHRITELDEGDRLHEWLIWLAQDYGGPTWCARGGNFHAGVVGCKEYVGRE